MKPFMMYPPPHFPARLRPAGQVAVLAAAIGLLLVLLLTPFLRAVGAASGDAPLQSPADIATVDDAFGPTVITVTVGTTVRWMNRGGRVHTTTSDVGLWNWTMVPGARFSATFLTPGTYAYHCIYHVSSGMRGRVVVTRQAGPGPTIPPPPPPGGAEGDIVFDDYTGAMSSTSDLFSIKPDGTGKAQLTQTEDLYEAQPRWSPDRQRIAYTASAGASVLDPWRLHILDPVTGQDSAITAGPEHYEPDWSPDGALIAHTSITRMGRQATGSSIDVVLPDGTGARTLISLNSTSFALASPTWSPDGQQIAFTVRSDATGGELYVMNADGSRARRLLAHSGWDDLDAAWSPDGRYVAFASGINRGDVALTTHDIWVVDMRTGVYGIVAMHSVWDLRRPAWSPDGRYLVFSAQIQPQPSPRWALYLVPATGGAVTGPLTMGAEPDWGSEALVPLPTPNPGATPTMVVPPPPPLFPTFPPPEPTLPGPPPTFPPSPEETPTLGPPPVPTSMARARVYLTILNPSHPD